jgi:hypothetical protein
MIAAAFVSGAVLLVCHLIAQRSAKRTLNCNVALIASCPASRNRAGVTKTQACGYNSAVTHTVPAAALVTDRRMIDAHVDVSD